MTQGSVVAELIALQRQLQQPTVWVELAVVAGCVAVTWLLVRLVRGHMTPEASARYGKRTVDGVLFPALLLALTYGAGRVLSALDVPLALFKLAIPVLLSFALIRLSARVLRAAFPDSRFVRTLERSISWIAWLVVVLWITGLLPAVMAELDDVTWTAGKAHMTLRKLIEGALTAGFVLMLVLWASTAIEARLLKGATGDQLSLRKVAANTVRALLVFIGLLTALSSVGLDLTALSVLGGAVGVGVGLGLQRLAANYVSGFVVLTERALRIGDLVRVDNFEGHITDIKSRYTLIRAANGRTSIVPNETLTTQRVENASLAQPDLQVTSTVRLAYGGDVDALIPTLVAAIGAVPRVLAQPEPSVQLTAFLPEGFELTLNFWVQDPESGFGTVRSDVNLAALRCISAAGMRFVIAQPPLT